MKTWIFQLNEQTYACLPGNTKEAALSYAETHMIDVHTAELVGCLTIGTCTAIIDRRTYETLKRTLHGDHKKKH